MAKFSQVLLVTLSGLLMSSALPQYGQSDDVASAPPAPPPSASLPSYASPSVAAPAPMAAAPSYSSGSSSNSNTKSGSSDDLTVQCKATPDNSGKIKYDCSGVNKDAVTLKTEHFLELERQSDKNQNLEIEIPNYNIDEFIKAAYKALGPQEGAKINILLKKPDITCNAEKEEPQAQQQPQPSVSVNYQPVEKVRVHYPTEKQYRNAGSSAGVVPTIQGPAQAAPAPSTASSSYAAASAPAKSASPAPAAPPAPTPTSYVPAAHAAPPAPPAPTSYSPAASGPPMPPAAPPAPAAPTRGASPQ